MIADKHLGACTESQCKYCSGGVCVFSLRTKIGCYLKPEVKKITAELLSNAMTINSKEIIRG